LTVLGLLACPFPSPAPLIYRPGEGWTYEMPGATGGWRKDRAKDQIEHAQKAFDNKNYSQAKQSAQRVVNIWPLSDYAPQALYLVGRCWEAKKRDDKAFKTYQELVEKYPKLAIFQEVQQRQFDIATRFLHGQRFKLLGVPLFPSMEKTAVMFDKIVKSGPYGNVAPQAQVNVGMAREKQKDYELAIKAYELAADRYHELRAIAADATFKGGMAYKKESRTGEYDQNLSSQAIATLSDFVTLFPEEPRVPEAQRAIQTLKAEQARGNFRIARFYEKTRILPKKARTDGALIYYNEVLLKTPDSPLADEARRRMEVLKQASQP
jgi:outer membrane protein assembly factor BamD